MLYLPRPFRGIFAFILVVFVLPVAFAQQNISRAVASQTGVNAVPADPQLRSGTSIPGSSISNGSLSPGDLVEVGVYNVPELSTRARIGSNGNIYLPLVDYVHIAGLTTEEAQDVIQHKLIDGGFVRNPHVSIYVAEHGAPGISLLGEVARPGIYPMQGQEHLFDLISAAGGFTDKAGRSISITHRSDPDNSVVVPLSRNLSDNPTSNIEVFAGDTVIVRKADVVYVVGDVGRASGFLMDNGHITVLQAIALAGGTNKTAKLNGVKIIHRGPAGMTETPVQLKKILRAKAPDQSLEAEDILFVPSSAAKVAAARTFDAALQAASAVGIVAVHP